MFGCQSLKDMNEEFIIRKVVENDMENLVKLYDEVWSDVDMDFKDKANFVLRESTGVSYCAEKEGRLVGSRTSFFMPAYYGSRRLNCVQFADSCISKDCRRKGLFLKMNQAFLNAFFKEQPGELIYNISVDASRAAYEKLGWNYIKSLQELRCYPNIFKSLLKVKFDIRKFRGAPIYEKKTEVCKLPKELLEAREQRMLKSDKIHIRYNPDAFNWRMKSANGIKVLNIANMGAVVYKIGKKPSGLVFLFVGEIFLYDYTYENFNKLFKRIKNLLNTDIITVAVTLGHPLLSYYKKWGLKNSSNSFHNQGVRVETEEMKRIAYEPENWALSFLDIDTF